MLLAITKSRALTNLYFECEVYKCHERAIVEKGVRDLDAGRWAGETEYRVCGGHCSDAFVLEMHRKNVEADRYDYMESRGCRHA